MRSGQLWDTRVGAALAPLVFVGRRWSRDVRILAWASLEASRGAITQTGALGPVAAFGLDALRAAAENAGLTQV
jgi:hypothetical protein